MHDEFQSCIEACNRCAAECEHCATACLHEADVGKMARCIALDRDCARICFAAVGFMAGGSPFARAVCRLCAEICRECANECRKHSADHCQACAEACKRCADECERMATAAT